MDLFSIEGLDNEILCVCNLCDTRLDNKSEPVKHQREQHGKGLFADRGLDKWTNGKIRDCGTSIEWTIDKY